MRKRDITLPQLYSIAVEYSARIQCPHGQLIFRMRGVSSLNYVMSARSYFQPLTRIPFLSDAPDLTYMRVQ